MAIITSPVHIEDNANTINHSLTVVCSGYWFFQKYKVINKQHKMAMCFEDELWWTLNNTDVKSHSHKYTCHCQWMCTKPWTQPVDSDDVIHMFLFLKHAILLNGVNGTSKKSLRIMVKVSVTSIGSRSMYLFFILPERVNGEPPRSLPANGWSVSAHGLVWRQM